MNKELIPIIAAYWGAECSYEYLNLFDDGYTEKEKPVCATLLAELEIEGFVRNFKLHLRQLWSITEVELRELAEAIPGGYDFYKMPSINAQKEWTRRVLSDDCNLSVQTIDFLRSRGFCINQSLIDAGLVEWKETT